MPCTKRTCLPAISILTLFFWSKIWMYVCWYILNEAQTVPVMHMNLLLIHFRAAWSMSIWLACPACTVVLQSKRRKSPTVMRLVNSLIPWWPTSASRTEGVRRQSGCLNPWASEIVTGIWRATLESWGYNARGHTLANTEDLAGSACMAFSICTNSSISFIWIN